MKTSGLLAIASALLNDWITPAEATGLARGEALGEKLTGMAFDAAGMTADEWRVACDNNLATFTNVLEKFDPKFYTPRMDVQYGRDIKMRGDVEMSDEAVSFFRETFQGTGTVDAQGIPWIDPNATQLPGVSIDGQKVTAQVRLAAREVTYTSVELEKSRRYGRPLDVAKLDALNKLYQLGTDRLVYVGATGIQTGLLNDANVPHASFGNGAWANVATTADEIIEDFREALNQAWENSGRTRVPTDCLIEPAAFSTIVSRKVGTTGDMSIARWVSENSLSNSVNGKPLNIRPSKWLTGRGEGGADRALFYTNNEEDVRFAMVPMRREMAYNRGLLFCAPYLWAYGPVETPHPETMLYRDGTNG
jgi:hypothetical protein